MFAHPSLNNKKYTDWVSNQEQDSHNKSSLNKTVKRKERLVSEDRKKVLPSIHSNANAYFNGKVQIMEIKENDKCPNDENK